MCLTMGGSDVTAALLVKKMILAGKQMGRGTEGP